MKVKDHLVEKPQTICWYERIRITLNQKTPYAVERIVEPEAFRIRRDSYSHNNKWTGYLLGLHIPQKRIRMLAELASPGSSGTVENPLWRVSRLAQEVSISEFADDWLRQLGADLHPLFFRLDPRTDTYIRRGVSARKLRLLNERADLDSLAAMSILLREAAERQHYAWAMRIADFLYATLIRVAINRDEALRLALPYISEMLATRVFCFARDLSNSWCFEGIDFVALLNTVIFVFHEPSPYRGPNAAVINSMMNTAREHELLGVNMFRLPLRPLGSNERTGFVQDESDYRRRRLWLQQLIGNVAGSTHCTDMYYE